MTNVTRHAKAHHCVISFSLDEKASEKVLQLKIVDDGNGFANDDKTVRNHITDIFSKLQGADRAQAIIKARNAGLAEN